MLPEALGCEPFMEEAEHRERVEKLCLPLMNEIAAVGIQHQAVALKHIDHLQQMIRCVSEERRIREQTPDQFLQIGKGGFAGLRSGGGGHESPPGWTSVASSLSWAVAGWLRPTSRFGTTPRRRISSDIERAGIC